MQTPGESKLVWTAEDEKRPRTEVTGGGRWAIWVVSSVGGYTPLQLTQNAEQQKRTGMQTVSYVPDVTRETVGVGTAGNGTAPSVCCELRLLWKKKKNRQ